MEGSCPKGKKSRRKHMVMKDKDYKKITQKSEVLKIWENRFNIHLNIQYHRQENTLNSIPEALS